MYGDALTPPFTIMVKVQIGVRKTTVYFHCTVCRHPVHNSAGWDILLTEKYLLHLVYNSADLLQWTLPHFWPCITVFSVLQVNM